MKEVKAPFEFDVEHGIALHAMQGNKASSHGGREVSSFSLIGGGNLGYILELLWVWPFKIRVYSAMSGVLSRCEGCFGILPEALQGKCDAFQGEMGDPLSLSRCHRDIGVPINLQEESGMVSF